MHVRPEERPPWVEERMVENLRKELDAHGKKGNREDAHGKATRS